MPPQRLSSGKVPLALTLTIVSIIYAVWLSFGGGQQPVTAVATMLRTTTGTTQSTAQQNDIAQTNPVVTKPPSTMSTPTQQKPTGQYIDGIYTGTPADAYYGTVQVQAAIQNGRIAGVTFLQHPSDRSTSIAVNNMAMPILTQEAIQAQSAQVNTASGATFTSEAFRQSLATALAQAKN